MNDVCIKFTIQVLKARCKQARILQHSLTFKIPSNWATDQQTWQPRAEAARQTDRSGRYGRCVPVMLRLQTKQWIKID